MRRKCPAVVRLRYHRLYFCEEQSISSLPLLITLFSVLTIFVVPIQAVLAETVSETPTATAQQIKSADDLVLHDASRNKDLHVHVTYPVANKPLPTIVFSHGAGGSKNSYPYLSQYWAENGFIVIQPTHADSIGKPKNALIGLRKLMSEIHKLPTDYPGWNNRFRDITFVIDSVDKIQKECNIQIDMQRLGVGGHSYGAFTAVIIGGGKVPKVAQKFVAKDPRDSRVKAIMAISPQALRTDKERFGFDDDTSWQNITEPAMFMTGTYDQTGWTKAAERRQAFAGCPAGGKFFVMIEGANHMTFAGRTAAKNASKGIAGMFARTIGPPEKGDHELMLKAIQFTSTKFWNVFVKEESAPQTLRPEDFKSLNSLIQIEPK